ncbi:MAG: sensor histidine kinase, partial [Chloroflexi bacterium]|nr:sensor histidine kinase [Chloroflexota bacterium]
ELRLGPVNLVALVAAAVAANQATTEEHRIVLETAEPSLVGHWDATRLERVVDNLLGNAVKYSPGGGTIVVSLAQEQDGVRAWGVLAVRDEGVGIPAADLPHLFERYHRGGNVAGIAGTGIGLAGARQIIAQHGGTITVTSAQGVGTTFVIRLPLAPPEGPVVSVALPMREETPPDAP